jgi:IS605 OrfB family transposase
MKTVIYHIPVQPVEEKVGRKTLTKASDALKKINDEAYHLANRAVTLWLNSLYPLPSAELEELKAARNKVKDCEQKIKAIYNSYTAKENEEQVNILREEKKKELVFWENKVVASGFYKDVKEIIKKEFPDFPEKLRQELLHKVVLDWLYSWMNYNEANNFTADFPFYKHETHLPLCYDGEEIKWKKNLSSKNQPQQYILQWLNNIQLVTCFNDLDRRLPKVIEYLYFSQSTSDSRNRKAHRYLKPTLKQAGTKWSIHLPVLEKVVPVVAEKQDPICIIFGFIYPLCYAWGINHARALSIDSGKYIEGQARKFARRIEKIKENNKISGDAKHERINKIEFAKANYIEALENKAVNAIIEVAKKSQKNRICIEKWPIDKNECGPMQECFKQPGLPDLHARLLHGIESWNFNSFYKKLIEQTAVYGISIEFIKPCWDWLNLYTDTLTYDFKNHIKHRKEKRNWRLQLAQRIPHKYYTPGNPDEREKRQEGYSIFIFDKEYNNTNGGFTLYSSPKFAKRKSDKYIYRIHIDINMAMNAAFAGQNLKNQDIHGEK